MTSAIQTEDIISLAAPADMVPKGWQHCAVLLLQGVLPNSDRLMLFHMG